MPNTSSGGQFGFQTSKNRWKEGKLRQKKADRRRNKKFGDMKNCYAVADQESKPIKHNGQTSCTNARLERMELSFLHNARQTPFSGRGLSKHGHCAARLVWTKKWSLEGTTLKVNLLPM